MSRILLFKLVVTGVKIIDVNHTMLSPFQNITAILNSYSCLRCRTLRCEERTWRNISLPNRKGNVEKITFWNTFILCFCVRSYFICERWLAVEQDDGAVDRVLPVATKAELTQFSQLFFTSSREKLFDDHLWFSLFTRPTKRYVPNKLYRRYWFLHWLSFSDASWDRKGGQTEWSFSPFQSHNWINNQPIRLTSLGASFIHVNYQ